MNEEAMLYQIQDIIRTTERLNAEVQINTRKLNDAIKEMRGLVGFVRPRVKKNPWYSGEELETTPECIDPKAIDPPKRQIPECLRIDLEK
jgi:hypothetical protein